MLNSFAFLFVCLSSISMLHSQPFLLFSYSCSVVSVESTILSLFSSSAIVRIETWMKQRYIHVSIQFISIRFGSVFKCWNAAPLMSRLITKNENRFPSPLSTLSFDIDLCFIHRFHFFSSQVLFAHDIHSHCFNCSLTSNNKTVKYSS